MNFTFLFFFFAKYFINYRYHTYDFKVMKQADIMRHKFSGPVSGISVYSPFLRKYIKQKGIKGKVDFVDIRGNIYFKQLEGASFEECVRLG